MNFAAITFSWLVTAYFVGRKLSVFQVTALTFLYGTFSPFPMMSAHESLTAYRNLTLRYLEAFKRDEAVSLLMQYGPELLIVLFGTLWSVSVVFMFQTRGFDKEKGGRT